MRTLRRILATILVGGFLIAFPTSPAFAKKCEYATGLSDSEWKAGSWGQQHLDAERVWPLATGSGIEVAVIDSGVSDRHRSLRGDGKVEYGSHFPDDGMATDCDRVGHGTVIAGVIAGREDTRGQFHGMAPDATIYAIRMFADVKHVSDPAISDDVAEAIDEAVEHGADIVNLSLGVGRSAKLEKAVKRAHRAGVLLVAAAGNQKGDGNQQVFPAAYGTEKREDVSVLAVANLTERGETDDTSNRDRYVDVAAPGTDVIGPSPISETGYSQGDNGTSYAVPFVSGTAALVMDRYPGITPAEVAERITKTAEHPPGGRDDDVGFGMVNPYRAVTADLDADAEHVAASVPRQGWPGDTEYFARRAAGVLLLVTVVVSAAVVCARVVAPRLRRRRESATG